MATQRRDGAAAKPKRTFTCLYCNRPFQFPYTTGPKPLFCSRACLEKDYYRRRQARDAGREPVLPGDWPQGRALSVATAYLEPEPLTCARCGRPLGQGESLGPWHLRVSSASSRVVPEFWPICPAHYGEEPVFDEEGESNRDSEVGYPPGIFAILSEGRYNGPLPVGKEKPRRFDRRAGSELSGPRQQG